MNEGYQGPLSGLRVIDASSVIAGPLTGQLMRLFGAEVIKLELPGDGDRVRFMGPKAAPSTMWSFLSQDKQCVTCKMSNPSGADLVRRLVAKANVLIENYRPGTMEKWGLGPNDLHAVNPQLTILRITGFGQDGPYRDRPGYGTLAEAMSGLAHLNGEPDGPPILPSTAIGDTITGLTGAVAVLASLVERAHKSSEPGAVIDVNIYEALTYFLTPSLIEAQATGTIPMRQGSRAYGGAPRNAATCRDGKWVAYSIQSRKLLDALVSFLGLEGDPHYDTSQDPAIFGDDLDASLRDYLSRYDRTEALACLGRAGLPIAPVNDAADLMGDEHLRARGDFATIQDATYGPLKVMRSPARVDGWRQTTAASGFVKGAHNQQVYRELLGLSEAEIKQLEFEGTI